MNEEAKGLLMTLNCEEMSGWCRGWELLNIDDYAIFTDTANSLFQYFTPE